MEITKEMSKESKDRAEKEALENAQKVIEEINVETEAVGEEADLNDV